MDTPQGRLLTDLVDTAEVQRLRRIRQLGLGHFAYQGAEHSRFTHSLGALHLATRILAKLSSKYDISESDTTAVRCAALLHDIGHGPFSHVIEPILDFHHEDFTVMAVLSPETDVGRALSRYSAGLPERVAAIIRGTFRPTALAQIVSSQIDADRMDYLLRDSHMTGVKYGIFDLEWIIKSLEIDEQADRLYVSARGLYAVEDYLQARYYMYRQVYFHRTLRSAEAILQSIIRRVLSLVADGSEVWYAAGTPVEKIVRGEKLLLSEHMTVDDADILYHIKQWKNSADEVLSDLSMRFLDRRLFTAFDLDMPEAERSEFTEAARAVVASHGFDPNYYFIEDNGGGVPHFFYAIDGAEPKDMIYVEAGFSRKGIHEISEISAAVRGLQKGYRIDRVSFPAELKEEVAAVYHS